MHLDIFHRTRYNYDVAVSYALLQLRMMPDDTGFQNVQAWDIILANGYRELEFTDHNNNRVMLVSLQSGHREIDIQCQGLVETRDNAGITGKPSEWMPLWYYQRDTALTRSGPAIRELVKRHRTTDMSIDSLHMLSERIASAIRYENGITSAMTTAEESLQAQCGVCQDHAHVFISAARLIGFPARYISGYLMMDGQIHQEAGHAWAEAWIEHLGWVGFDVSNGICPDDRYVRVATGLDYREAAPVQGMRFGEGDESMSVQLQIQQQ